jgi:hypothetical protein
VQQSRIEALARALIARHGVNAEQVAVRTAKTFEAAGDLVGAEKWKQVARTVARMRARSD